MAHPHSIFAGDVVHAPLRVRTIAIVDLRDATRPRHRRLRSDAYPRDLPLPDLSDRGFVFGSADFRLRRVAACYIHSLLASRC